MEKNDLKIFKAIALGLIFVNIALLITLRIAIYKSNTTATLSSKFSNNIETYTRAVNLDLISFNLPSEWLNNGNFTISVGEADESNGIYEVVYFKSTSNLSSGGLLYKLYIVDKDFSNIDDLFIDSQKTITSDNKYRVIGGTATDVEFADNEKEFNYLSQYINTITDSIILK